MIFRSTQRHRDDFAIIKTQHFFSVAPAIFPLIFESGGKKVFRRLLIKKFSFALFFRKTKSEKLKFQIFFVLDRRFFGEKIGKIAGNGRQFKALSCVKV